MTRVHVGTFCWTRQQRLWWQQNSRCRDGGSTGSARQRLGCYQSIAMLAHHRAPRELFVLILPQLLDSYCAPLHVAGPYGIPNGVVIFLRLSVEGNGRRRGRQPCQAGTSATSTASSATKRLGPWSIGSTVPRRVPLTDGRLRLRRLALLLIDSVPLAVACFKRGHCWCSACPGRLACALNGSVGCWRRLSF